MSVGARLFGAKAIVFLSKNVPKAFANKLKAIGADVKFQGNDYEESMIVAEVYARKNNYVLLSDSTWETCQSGVDVMEGYMIIGNEVHNQLLQCNLNGITHVFLQAGVGGFAAALALSLRKFLREDIQIIIVEPTEAKTLFISLQNEKPSIAEGQVSIMGRLDCKEPSWSAFYSLSKTSNYFMHLEDDYVNKKINTLGDFGISTTPSGGAGIAALMYATENKLFGINKDSSPLVFLTEDAI
ncbi:MAG: pyridoxal-phosphate dependent enzyme [Paracoccaceae bacterium]